jgi:phosphoribosylformylglycinamidine synthase
MRARVTVYPRREILDPQGKAIQGALAGIGFAEVESVRAGKSFEITLGVSDPGEADLILSDMCERLLANTLVEEYRVELLEGDADGGGAA